jgi:hypothetical protein
MRARFVPQTLAALVLILTAAAPPPSRLSAAEFWLLVDGLSENGGFFRSDNLVSNEDTFQTVLPELTATVRPGGAYLGVGPDQNFTYIAATDPAIAFITDIRRGNLQLHLMYKAIFELSESRVEFLSRLLSRPGPAGLQPTAPADAMIAAFAAETPTRQLFVRTRAEIVRHLEQARPLDPHDREGIEYVLEAFYQAGPALSYSNTVSGRGRYPTFGDLQRATDGQGTARGYLASEALYGKVRRMHQRNLIVPVVGDFAGAKALRAIGDYVRTRRGRVTTLYASNVEQYLFQNDVWRTYYQNVSALPLDDTSTFIRSFFPSASPGGQIVVSTLDPRTGLTGRLGEPSNRFVASESLLCPVQDLLDAVADGRVTRYLAVVGLSR